MAGPWEKYGQAAGAPPVIQGPPKVMDLGEAQRLGLSVNADERADRAQGVTESNQRFDNIAKMRTEFNSRKEVADYTTVLPQIADAMKMARNPNATGADDLSLIYTFGKVMDPGSVVREGELALASGTGSFAQNLEGAISKLQSGQKLPPEVRMNLVRAMQRRGVELARNYNRQRDNYRGLAGRATFNPDDVIGIHPGGDFQQIEADFLSQPIRNRDGSMGAMPAGAAPQGEPPNAFRPGTDPQPSGGDPLQPGPDGWVRGAYKPDVTDETAGATRLRAQAMIREGADYETVARFLHDNGLAFRQEELRAATESNSGIVTSGSAGVEGFVKGALHPIDRAAEGLENGVNAVLGTDFNSAERVNDEREAYFAAHPYDKSAETVGNIASSAAATWRLGPTLGGAAGNVLAGDSDTGIGIATDATVGALGGKAADLTLRGAANLIAPKVNPAASRLAQEGVPLTPGQLGSRRSVARRVEERATSLPGGGGAAIEAARDRSIIGFNRAAANRALKNIGKTVPNSVEPGNQTVAFVEEALGQEYDSILSQARVSLDMAWAGRVAAVRRKANLPPEQAAQFDEIIAREISTTFGRNPNGSAVAHGGAYKKLDEKLGDVAAGYMQSDDPYTRALGSAIADVRDQTAGQLRRQNPKLAKRLKSVDEGWAQFVRIRQAASQTSDGIFTPGQLKTAVRQSDRSKSKGAVARGTATMHDLAKDGTAVLPSTVGSSGTADRLMTLDPRAWALGTVANGAYQEAPLNALTRFATAPRGPAAQGVANALRHLPGGALGGIGAGALLSPSPR